MALSLPRRRESLGGKCHCSWISWLSFVIIDNRMLKIITSVFIVTRRLEKYSILKFIRFKLPKHCNILTFLLRFFFYISWVSLCVGYLPCLHFFSIWFLACVPLAYSVVFKKHFVSISSVTFWHLYSTNAFKGARSLREAVRVLTWRIQTRYSQSIRLHVHLNILGNLLSAQHFHLTQSLLTLFSCKIICFLMPCERQRGFTFRGPLFAARALWLIRFPLNEIPSSGLDSSFTLLSIASSLYQVMACFVIGGILTVILIKMLERQRYQNNEEQGWKANTHSCTRGWWRRKRSGKSCTGPYNQH